MTAQGDFKQRVRQHMAATGLSYQAARRSLLEHRSEENDMTTNAYGPDTITTTDTAVTLADIRRSPERYVVDTGPLGIEHLALELVSNSLDEATAGAATSIAVVLGEDGSTFVRDDGRAIPVEAVERAFTQPGSTGKQNSGAYAVPAGAHGLGLAAVVALSARLRVWIERDGRRYEAELTSTDDAPGSIVRPVTDTGPAGPGSSMSIQLWPDPAVFGLATADIDRLTERLATLAAVHDGVVITLTAPGAGPAVVGAPESLGRLLGSGSTTTRKYVDERGRAQVALTEASGESTVLRSFVNGIETVGGSHVDAALAARPEGAWMMVVSVWVRRPTFTRSGGGYVVSDADAAALVSAAMAPIPAT